MDKKFKDTKVGKFVGRLLKAAPELLPVAMEIVPGAKGVAALVNVAKILREKTIEKPELQELQLEAEEMLQEFIIELMSLENADRASARNREIETSKTRKIDWLQVGVGSVMALSFLTCLSAILFFDIPKENRELVIHILSVIEGGFLGSMIPYYFGGASVSRRVQRPLSVNQDYQPQSYYPQSYSEPNYGGYLGE